MSFVRPVRPRGHDSRSRRGARSSALLLLALVGCGAEPPHGASPQDSAALASTPGDLEQLQRELRESQRQLQEAQRELREREREVTTQAARLVALEEELQAARASASSGADAQVRVQALEAELAALSERLLRREEEFLSFTEALAIVGATEHEPTFEEIARVDPDAAIRWLQSADPETGEPKPDPARERAQAMIPELQALLTAEGVHAWIVLELGRLEAGAVGPVVLRLVDDWGRPAGLLAAEHLRLEASRSGRTVTLVLEEGREERSGVSVPFEGGASVDAPGAKARGGVRRLTLPGVDVEPWLETLPELFRPEDLEAPTDDGQWDLLAVQQELNRLLAEQDATGRWRVVGFAGIVLESLRDVQFAELDEAGQVRRRLFADSATLERAPGGGLRLRLLEGVQMLGAERTPFLEGRFTIAFPRADLERWRAVGVPGLAGESSPLRRKAPGASVLPALDPPRQGENPTAGG